MALRRGSVALKATETGLSGQALATAAASRVSRSSRRQVFPDKRAWPGRLLRGLAPRITGAVWPGGKRPSLLATSVIAAMGSVQSSTCGTGSSTLASAALHGYGAQVPAVTRVHAPPATMPDIAGLGSTRVAELAQASLPAAIAVEVRARRLGSPVAPP